MPNPKSPRGRKPKTLATSGFPENWTQIIIDGALVGKSMEEMKADIMLSMGKEYGSIKRLWDALREREVEFRTTVAIALELSKAWWLSKGRTTLDSHYFQYQSWALNMKNRFGFVDKMELDHGLTDDLLEKYKDMKADELIETTKQVARLIIASDGTQSGRSQAQIPQSS